MKHWETLANIFSSFSVAVVVVLHGCSHTFPCYRISYTKTRTHFIPILLVRRQCLFPPSFHWSLKSLSLDFILNVRLGAHCNVGNCFVILFSSFSPLRLSYVAYKHLLTCLSVTTSSRLFLVFYIWMLALALALLLFICLPVYIYICIKCRYVYKSSLSLCVCK